MKLLLTAYEQPFGLKINFHKSKIFCYGEAKEMELQYTSLFGCNVWNTHFVILAFLCIIDSD
jgi:hypothetical protein